MFDWVISSFQDARFAYVPIGAVLVGMAAFALFAGAFTWLAWADPAWARRWKIQGGRAARSMSQDEAARRNILVPGPRMLRLSTRSWLVNNACMLAAACAGWPLMSLSGVHLGPLPPAWVIALQVVLFVYLDDFLYYWMHRAMHTPWLLRHVHGWHHRVLTPWAVSGHYMHPLEYVLTGSLAFVGPALLGSHVLTLWIWIAVRQWEAAEGHSGYALPFSPTHWLPFSHGALHHDYHHARVRGNYAGFLPLWDRFFGTHVRDYEQAVDDWRGRKPPERA